MLQSVGQRHINLMQSIACHRDLTPTIHGAFYATLRSQGYDVDGKKSINGGVVRIVKGLHLA